MLCFSVPALRKSRRSGCSPRRSRRFFLFELPHSKKHRYDEQKEHKNRAYVQLIHHINSDPMPYTSPAINHAMTH